MPILKQARFSSLRLEEYHTIPASIPLSPGVFSKEFICGKISWTVAERG
jgi:hypothetical protein